MEIFDHNTVLKIRSKILEDGFEHYLVGSLAEIAENVGGRTITTDIEFDTNIMLELPAVGADRFDDVDIVNSSLVYEALPGLTAYEACRDELWASLSMGYYVQYVRRRWRPSSQQDFDLRRNYRLHYLASGVRSRWRDNAIGRLWWMQHFANTVVPENPQEALQVLYFRDKNLGETLLTKPSIAAVHSVAGAILRVCYEKFIDPGEILFDRDSFRAFIREIEVNSGRSLLALMPAPEVELLVRGEFAIHF
jgi:hypothetical protein